MTTHALPAPVSTVPAASRRLRSVGAVVAGFVSVAVLSTLVDAVMHATGVFPPTDAPPMSNALFALALAYRVVITIGGGALTARLAPSAPMRHAVILGVVGTLAGTAGSIAMWSVGPHWYPVAIVLTALPTTTLGARLARR
jgi:hypothetical protein